MDLTLANNKLLKDVYDWEISDEDSLSDHNYLKYTISLGGGNPTTKNSELQSTESRKKIYSYSTGTQHKK